jgi:gas vesicle protein
MREKWPFLAGLGLGIAMGAILAPQFSEGKFLRSKLQEGADYVGSVAEEIGNHAATIAAQAKSQVNEAIESGKRAYKQQRASA